MHPNDPDNDGRPGAEDLAIADNYIARLEAERDNLKERLQFCASRILPWKCTMGVGCDEAGVCYAAAHGQPDRCESALDAAGSAEAPIAWDVLLPDGKRIDTKRPGEDLEMYRSCGCLFVPLFARAPAFRAGIEAAAKVARAARFQSYGPQDHPERIAEAIEALAPPAGAGEWRPMDTAPKDGTEIIGYRPDQGVFVFRWALMEEFVPKDQHGDPTEPYDEDFACWWHDRWDWMEGELTPTLWQPLPSPPKGEEL